MKPSVIILLVFTLLMPWMLLAQGNSASREARFHSKALEYYHASAYDEALKELDKVFKANPYYIESWLLAGDIHSIRGNRAEAIRCYKRAIEIDEMFFPPALYILANHQFVMEMYAESVVNYQKFLSNADVRPSEKEKAEKNKELATFRIASMSNPVSFEPENLGNEVNTEGYEFVNYISADGAQLYLTRRRPKSQRKDEDFYVALNNNGKWINVTELGPPVNTPLDEGAMCLSPDGQFLFYAACNRPDGYGSCDLYVAVKKGDSWGEPQNLGPSVNTSFWESQPSFSPDGKTLYFVSNRPGGWGSSDIWITKLSDDGKWSLPENAGSVINTPDAERGPFIHPDGTTLYFSSKGHTGMGEGDIFLSRRSASGEWSSPENLGYPVNTNADEVTLVVDLKGKYAYISSAMEGGFGLTDIYRFKLPASAAPLAVTYLKGIVTDSITGKYLGADFVLAEAQTSEEIVKSRSDAASGSFLVCIPAGKQYLLSVTKPGYLFYSESFQLTGEADILKPHIRNIKLRPVKLDEITVLENIYFETDSARLLPESKAGLEVLFDFLRRNPSVSIEIGGHTDNTGSVSHNATLSHNRAKSVYMYLIDRGISADRLTYKGYGAEQPVASNETAEGKAANRRTEFRITGGAK